MADKVTSVVLSDYDQKRIARLRVPLTAQYGKITLTFIVREGLRALEQQFEEAGIEMMNGKRQRKVKP